MYSYSKKNIQWESKKNSEIGRGLLDSSYKFK